MAPLTASVTTRESLRWLPDAPLEEVVDILVLTSGKYYLDLRVFKTGQSKGTIDWSMAGVCLDLPGGTEERTPVRFLNIIDQRYGTGVIHPLLPTSLINPKESSTILTDPTPDDVVFTPLPSLPSSPLPRFLESGKMPNPLSTDTETYVPFEEVWQALPLAPGSPVLILETLGDDGLGKAYTGRIGNWRMGLMEDGKGDYLAWREDWKEGEWEEVYAFGEGVRDKIVAVEKGEESWGEGDVVELAGRKWVVRQSGVSA